MISSLKNIAQFMTVAAGCALLVVAVLVSIEVIFRHVFLVSFNAGSEISSYVLAIASSWGLAFTLLMRGHVRVDALIRLFPLRVSAWIDLFALAGLGAVAALFLWQAFATFQASWSMNAHSMTPLHVPLWIPQGLWVAGLAFFVIVIVSLLVRAGNLLIRGEYARSRRLIGVQEADEEAAEAVAEAEGLVGTRAAGGAA